MRRSSLLLLMLLCAATVYGRGATPKELVVDLKFLPQEGVHSSTASVPPSMLEKSVQIRVDDKRNDRADHWRREVRTTQASAHGRLSVTPIRF